MLTRTKLRVKNSPRIAAYLKKARKKLRMTGKEVGAVMKYSYYNLESGLYYFRVYRIYEVANLFDLPRSEITDLLLEDYAEHLAFISGEPSRYVRKEDPLPHQKPGE